MITGVVFPQNLQNMRRYFDSGVTRPYAFRRKQLQLLKQAVLKYESEINEALYADLRKNAEETYATETGLLLSEINVALKNLRRWMKPRYTATNLSNFPSSSRIYFDPLGVVLIISAWNYPLQLLLIPLVGAIAGGNCAVLKPSELAPATAALIAKMIPEFFPPGYVCVQTGDGADIIPAAMSAFRFDHVFYTGSIPVGRAIYQLAAKDLVPVTLELGGKSPAVIEDDADIASTARRIAIAKFANAGQTCVAPDYILVHERVKEKFIEKIKESIRHFYGENPATDYSYGKIINEKRFDRLQNFLTQGKIIAGGQHDKTSLFIAPTLLDEVSLDGTLMTEEIFGPLLPVFSFNNMEEALKIIQRNPNPLAFYVFTANAEKQRSWISRVAFGGGCVNNAAWHFANHYLPFGGVGNSGMGSYHGRHSFHTFTHAKAVMKTPAWFDPDIKYPPFQGKLKWFKMFIR